MLYKSTAYAVKDLDTKQGIIQAYWSAFSNVDDGGDVVMPGAFTKSISEWGPGSKQPRIKYLWQHDSGQLLGVPSALVQDDYGLLSTSQIVKTTLGQDVLLLYEAGVVTEHSIGYEVVSASFDRAKMARHLDQVKLYEGSAVTWGMNSQTPTVAVKSLTDATKVQARRDVLHKLLHSAPLRTELVAARLEDELKALEALLARFELPTQAPAERPVEIGSKSARASLDALAMQLAGTPAEGKAQAMPDEETPVKPAKRTRAAKRASGAKPTKARDFATIYATDREPWDLLEDLDDMWEALREAVTGMLIEGGDTGELATSLSQFSAAVTGWTDMAKVQDCWAEIADAAEEAQDRVADNYGSSYYGGYYYMGMVEHFAAKNGASGHTLEAVKSAPAAPALLKVGAQLSSTNRDVLTTAANGMAGAMADMKTHHKSLTDLLEKTAPASDAGDATGNDGADGDGENNEDPKKPNGGKSAARATLAIKTAPDRSTLDAGTTRDDGTTDLVAGLDALLAKAKRTAAYRD